MRPPSPRPPSPSWPMPPDWFAPPPSVPPTAWRSARPGTFPAGEAGAAHGVYRPGGSALNSGQVGATRAAQYIAAKRTSDPVDEAAFAAAAEPVLADATGLVRTATQRAADGAEDNTGTLLTAVQELMSAKAGPVRAAQSINEALVQVHQWLTEYSDQISADAKSRRSINRTFLVRDILTTAYVYLSAMADYVARGGRSRGSVLYTDPEGELPKVGYGPDAQEELDLPELFRFTLDDGALADQVQEVAWLAPEGAAAPVGHDGTERPDDGGGDWTQIVERDPADPAGRPQFRWRPVRPIPADDDFFENVWQDFREHGNIY